MKLLLNTDTLDHAKENFVFLPTHFKRAKISFSQSNSFGIEIKNASLKLMNKVCFFTFLLFINALICNGQIDTVISKNSLSIHAGTLISFIKQEKINWSPAISYAVGLSFKKQINKSASIILMMNYQRKYFNNLKTEFYELQYKKDVTLNTSFVNHELECPIIYNYDNKKIQIGFGINVSYLIASKINQNPSGDFGAVDNGIKAKYTLIDHPSTAPFHKTNVSPLIHIAYYPTKRIGFIYQVSYELLKNPLPDFSYFNQYNFINNKLMLTFKLK